MCWDERSGNIIRWSMLFSLAFLLLVLVIFASVAFSYETTLQIPSKTCPHLLSTVVDPGAVRGVMDGDTFAVYLFGPGGAIKLRVYEAWTPEEGEPNYEEAKLFTLNWLMQGPFRVTTCGKHTFERIVAIVDRKGRTLTADLEAAGFSQKETR